MSEIRLVKAAAELNVSVQTIVESLQKKGFAIDNKPTAKLSEEMYKYVSTLFVSDKAAKEESKSQGLKLKKREDIVKAEEPVAKKVPEIIEKAEEAEVLIKNVTPVKEVIPEEKKPSKKEVPEKEAVSETADRITAPKVELNGLNVKGKIDLTRKKPEKVIKKTVELKNQMRK